MANIPKKITQSGYRRFSYDPERKIFSVDETEVPLAQYNRSVSKISDLPHPETYYESSALLLGKKGWMTPLVQTPCMTDWLAAIEDAGGQDDMARKITEIMNIAISDFRAETGENGFDLGLYTTLWRGDVNVSTIDSHTHFGIEAYQSVIDTQDEELGYREYGGNNMNDIMGDAHRVAFMAGVGALAHLCMVETT